MLPSSDCGIAASILVHDYLCLSCFTGLCQNNKVLHPLNGELLITGAVASVTWKSSVEVDGESESSGSPDQGVDLWAVLPGGQEALIARGVGIECGVRFTVGQH